MRIKNILMYVGLGIAALFGYKYFVEGVNPLSGVKTGGYSAWSFETPVDYFYGDALARLKSLGTQFGIFSQARVWTDYEGTTHIDTIDPMEATLLPNIVKYYNTTGKGFLGYFGLG